MVPINPPHIILGISPHADKNEVKQAYRQLAKKYHPDLYDGDKAYANEKFKEIKIAYEKMLDFAPDAKPGEPNSKRVRIYRVVKAHWNEQLKIYEISIEVPEPVARENPIIHVMAQGTTGTTNFKVELPNIYQSSVIMLKFGTVTYRVRFLILALDRSLF